MKKLLFLSAVLLFGLVSCSTTEPPIPVTNVTLTPTTLRLTVGENATLTATITPRDADNQQKRWESSNNNIASVNNGQVTANAPGTATIIVRTADGNFTDTAEVEVFGTTDAGVEINGIRWATRNVALPGSFAHNPEDAGMFFQWNRRIGWSSTDPLINSDGGTTWDSTPETGTAWHIENDPCPQGWRVPTSSELNLLNHQVGAWTQRNGVNGRVFGTVPNQIFLPAAGRRNAAGTTLDNVGTSGHYWSRTQESESVPRAWALLFGSTYSSAAAINNRAGGLSIRCVKIK